MEASLEDKAAPFCSAVSLQAEEPLIGTATQTNVYFLLEYTGAWGDKAFAQSNLTAEVKDHLDAALKTISGARLLLIKNSSTQPGDRIRFFVASLADNDPALYRLELASYADLLAVDIPAILQNGGGPATRHSEPLFVVCTNGKRDPCCARYGPSFYTEMTKNAPHAVWQCTHVGGHRFAANLGCLPHGLFYGRLRPQDAQPVVESYARGEIMLSHLRGRASYPEVVQAAEYYLHAQTRDLGVDSFRWVDSNEVVQGTWAVRFSSARTNEVYRLLVSVEAGRDRVIQSCGATKVSPVIHYRLVEAV